LGCLNWTKRKRNRGWFSWII